MNQPVPPPSQPQGFVLHQQKLYALIIALVAFVGMILPWATQSYGAFGGGISSNGFGGWGLLSLFGIVGVIIATFLEDKARAYSATTKLIAMCSFGGVILGAFIVFMSLTGRSGIGSVKTGIGVWMVIIAGVFGLLIAGSIIKVPDRTTGMGSSSSPMPPPNRPGAPPTTPVGGPPPPPPPR